MSPARIFTVAALALVAGCHFPISQQIAYKKDGETVAAAAEPAKKAAKKNDLVVGIRRFTPTVKAAEAIADANDPREVGEPSELGRQFHEELLAAKIFKEVHYPLEDQAVDVIIEGVIHAELSRNHGVNFVKVLPGILALMPWLDSFGLGYDHEIGLELKVLDGQKPDAGTCDVFNSKSELTVKRYPSVFFGLGLHAGFFVLSVLEAATTDVAVADRLVQRNASYVNKDAIEWLAKEFEPTARSCPKHPDVKAAGKFCPVCGTNLRYPILNKAAKP